MLDAIRLQPGRTLDFERVRIMGVVNVTPDSFSDGGRYLDAERAITRGLELAAAGADLLDVGGESTRPGAAPVSVAAQQARVLPVIGALAARTDVPISVDTTSAEVAAAALDGGASLVNDVSAFRFDPEMVALLAERGVPAVAMHTLAAPRVMQRAPRYDDVVREVVAHLAERLEVCAAAGVDVRQLMVDPGIGFGKTVEHNLLLLRHLDQLVALGRPVLVGTSNKSFLGAITGRPVGERLAATAASCAVAVALGANVVRVHDVAGVIDAVRVAEAIAGGAPRD